MEVRAPGSSDRTAPSDRVDRLPPSWIDRAGRGAEPTYASVGSSSSAAILDGAPDPVVAIDCRGRVQYTNPACAKLLGTASAEVIGRHVSDLLEHHEPDQDTQIGRAARPRGDPPRIGRHTLDFLLRESRRASRRDRCRRRRLPARRNGAAARRVALSRQAEELEQTIRSWRTTCVRHWSRCSASRGCCARTSAPRSASAVPTSWIASPPRAAASRT